MKRASTSHPCSTDQPVSFSLSLISTRSLSSLHYYHQQLHPHRPDQSAFPPDLYPPHLLLRDDDDGGGAHRRHLPLWHLGELGSQHGRGRRDFGRRRNSSRRGDYGDGAVVCERGVVAVAVDGGEDDAVDGDVGGDGDGEDLAGGPWRRRAWC